MVPFFSLDITKKQCFKKSSSKKHYNSEMGLNTCAAREKPLKNKTSPVNLAQRAPVWMDLKLGHSRVEG